MARIRTVKPDFFRHEGLFQAEKETGLPIRVAFCGLFTVADKAGRFRWKPRVLKLDVLPYDDIDFGRVLDALVSRGFIVHYASGRDEYGCIPTFGKHQAINNRETESNLPSPTDDGVQIIVGKENIDATATREPREEDATQSCSRGREGEREGEGNNNTGVASDFQLDHSPSAALPRHKGGDKAEMSENEKELYHLIQESFEGVTGAFADYRREGPAIKRIMTFAARDSPADPKEFVRRMLVVFRNLSESQDKYWSSQPFIPSVLASGGIWPRVKKELEKAEGKVEGLDESTVAAAVSAIGASRK